MCDIAILHRNIDTSAGMPSGRRDDGGKCVWFTHKTSPYDDNNLDSCEYTTLCFRLPTQFHWSSDRLPFGLCWIWSWKFSFWNCPSPSPMSMKVYSFHQDSSGMAAVAQLVQTPSESYGRWGPHSRLENGNCAAWVCLKKKLGILCKQNIPCEYACI